MAAEETQQDGSKTLVSFVVGLLIGGMLVWAFSGPSDQADRDDHAHDDEAAEMSEEAMDEDESSEMTEEAAEATPEVVTLPTGDGSVVVNDQAAAARVALESATYPVSEGWIGVRDYNNGQLGFILGVVQFSEAAGIVPDAIPLQTPTIAGKQYAVVVFNSDGVRGFNAAGDAQIDEIFATFTAQ